MKNFRIIASARHENLKVYGPHWTVEAEYGSTVVTGSCGTLAHHAGEWAHCPPPCLGENIQSRFQTCPIGAMTGTECMEAETNKYCAGECKRDLTIGVSHFDLDCLGGVMRVLGRKNYYPDLKKDLFWFIAGLVDVRGPHRLLEIKAYEDAFSLFCDEWDEALTQLKAFWAWSQDHRLLLPRTGEVVDVTTFFEDAIQVLERIFEGDEALLQRGREWAEAQERFAVKSLNAVGENTLLRMAPQFVNHLYERNGRVFPAIVGYNPNTKKVTVSFERPIPGLSCQKIVRDLWGPTAGGRDVIGGSPREVDLGYDEAVRAFEYVESLLQK